MPKTIIKKGVAQSEGEWTSVNLIVGRIDIALRASKGSGPKRDSDIKQGYNHRGSKGKGGGTNSKMEPMGADQAR